MISPSAVMFRSSLVDYVGAFDENFPACEDYDLWLRVSCRFDVHLIDKPLTIKRGGHPDQLSTTVPSLDRFRIEAIAKLLDENQLSEPQRERALAVLKKKADVYIQGCVKRNKWQEVERIKGFLARNEALAAKIQ